VWYRQIITKHQTPQKRIVRRISKACKSYLRQVAGRAKQSVSKRPCPYEDCGCERVWFWGWYERKEGCIPLEDGDAVSGPIPLRRFLCTGCSRTFSWRPAFLLFGRRYATMFYQVAFKRWSDGCGLRASGHWYDLSASAQRAFVHFLSTRSLDFLARLDLRCSVISHEPDTAESLPGLIWTLSRRCARILVNRKHPPLSIHLFCRALARHKHAAIYRLDCL
jgi:hypothetical protein